MQSAKLRELYITGHSLGAAMAIVAAARIFLPLHDSDGDRRETKWRSAVRGVYAFAAPMVGDRAFAEQCAPLFGKLLFRHTYDRDVVPCLPPKGVDTSFTHFGECRYAARSTDAWTLKGKDRRAGLTAVGAVLGSFVTRRFDHLRGIGSLLFRYSLDDHSPRGYIDVSRSSVRPARERTKPAPKGRGPSASSADHAA